MADIAKADGLVPTKASAAGLVASLGTVRDASITFPKNKSGSPIVSIALDYVIGCNSGFGPVTYQEDVVDPANDDPNVHVYLSAIEIIDSNKATCIVAASPVVSISAAAKAFKATDKFTADDVYLHGMRLVKPLKAILPRGLAPAAASVSTQTAPADEDEMNDDVGGERRVTCMAFWSGAEFNPKTKKCEQRGRSGCSNPFKFKSVAECNAANKINQKPEGGMTCMAYWEGYNFNPSLNACEFGHASGCSNPFTYPNLRACLAKHKGADKPNDGVTCMAFWTGYVRDEASSKCVRAEGSGCKNPFTFKTAKECRAAKRS